MQLLPGCGKCRGAIELGQNVLFRPDGRVEHDACPDVSCSLCGHRIFPQDAIRRDGTKMLHAGCWLRRHRAVVRKVTRAIQESSRSAPEGESDMKDR